jgi:hypothetical protein
MRKSAPTPLAHVAFRGPVADQVLDECMHRAQAGRDASIAGPAHPLNPRGCDPVWQPRLVPGCDGASMLAYRRRIDAETVLPPLSDLIVSLGGGAGASGLRRK